METITDYKEKLDVIYEMIENSRTRIRENAFFYLLWGWLVLFASLSHFIMIKLDIFYSFLAWPVIMTIGMVISVIAGIRMGKRAGYITHIDANLFTFRQLPDEPVIERKNPLQGSGPGIGIVVRVTEPGCTVFGPFSREKITQFFGGLCRRFIHYIHPCYSLRYLLRIGP